MTVIKSGSGGNVAAVDDSNRLMTRAVIETSFIEAVLMGEGFALVTGDITLTTATESALFFFQNDNDSDLVFFSSAFSFGPSTGGSGTLQNISYTQSTAMTSGTGTDVIIGNLNLGNSQTTPNTSELGQEGASLDGPANAARRFAFDETFQSTFFIVIPKGSTLGISIIPPTGNTSMVVNATFDFYINRGVELPRLLQ